MSHRILLLVMLSLVLAVPLVAGAQPASGRALAEPSLAIVQDRIYRAGVFLIVDALVKNTSARRVEAAQVSVEFYNFFGELERLEHALLTPGTLEPGQVAALRVVTSNTDRARKMHYRFTWQQDGDQLQSVSRRDVWTIGAPTRNATSSWP